MGLAIGINGNSIPFGGHGFTPIDYIVDELGAEMAFSLRLVNSTYSGGLVRIRRDSDQAELDFLPDGSDILSMSSQDTGLTTTLGSWVGANSGFIATWYDQSGNGYNASNATAGGQPRIVNAGTLETDPDNGNVAMSLNTSWFSSIVGTSTTVQVFTHYIVGNRQATGVWYFSLGNLAISPQFLEWQTDNDIASRLSDQIVHSTADTSVEDFVFINLRDSSDNISAWKNGISLTGGTATATGQAIDDIFQNGNRNSSSYCQEIVLIHSDVESERIRIQNYANSYWGVY